jgi:hypothetical protein
LRENRRADYLLESIAIIMKIFTLRTTATDIWNGTFLTSVEVDVLQTCPAKYRQISRYDITFVDKTSHVRSSSLSSYLTPASSTYTISHPL